ncbi:hypothetical protein ABIA61_000757 [Paenibacillus sp. RC21]
MMTAAFGSAARTPAAMERPSAGDPGTGHGPNSTH